ncbi:F-box domain protein [Aspergillus terreus]|uniref:F-box domain protein n=1 Tax=Aspergillus terreus TaxID=33178 RepID=A0A5M3YNL5_ASPTE|nr:hypothetical protein ATETN484_0002021600 [Aspergillus terreus]GFF15072.1 F-box domain protein [Aspergillus terreus]
MTTQFYCAICSGPAGISAIGSSSPQALKLRRTYVEAKRLEKATGQRVPINFDSDWSSDDESDEGPYDPDDLTRFDPRLVSPESREWLHDIYWLRVDDFTGEGYLEGPASSVNNLRNYCENIDGEESLDTYYCYTTVNCVFPFHLCCFKLLLYSIFGDMEFDNIDKKVLYKVMMDTNPGHTRLDLDYGDVEGPDQYWLCEPGEEYCISRPTSLDERIQQFLRDKLQHDTFKLPISNVSIDQRHVVADPFGNLPVEVLFNILDMLPACSLLEFRKASATVCRATQSNGYWKQRMSRVMDWFWELSNILQDNPSGLNFKALYLWLEKKTNPELGMDPKFMGLGNRRRIWGACQQLRDLYVKRIPPETEGQQ